MKSLLHHINHTFRGQPAFWLLVAIGLLILAPLFMAALPEMKRMIFGLFLSLVVASGLLATYQSFRFLLIGISLGCAALVLTWLNLFREQALWLKMLHSFTLLVLSGLIGYHLFQLVYRSRKVNMNIIYASVAAYLFIGIIGGQACYLLELIRPGSFAYEGQSMLYDFQYFSLATLTTLGIEDVVPGNPQAKAITLLISLNGQLYLTIIIAILVGKYVSRSSLQ